MNRVAIQGIVGSYSHEATLEMLGPDVEVVECESFNLAIETAVNGTSEMAVLPVENKIVGKIEPAASLVETSGLRVLERLRLKIEHLLIGTKSAKFEDLVTVSSHVQALRQCGKFLDGNPHLGWVIGGDTASCVKAVVECGNESMAAIGSRRAGGIYGGKVLREKIADEAGNWTSFVLVGRV